VESQSGHRVKRKAQRRTAKRFGKEWQPGGQWEWRKGKWQARFPRRQAIFCLMGRAQGEWPCEQLESYRQAQRISTQRRLFIASLQRGSQRTEAAAGRQREGWNRQALRFRRQAQAGNQEARMSVNETSVPQLNPAREVIVAIDGPAGAGKSTIARHLAQRFGLLNLETGAMYRAFALKAQRLAVSLDDGAALERLAAETSIRLEASSEGNRVLLDSEDVTGLLRNQAVTDAASRVSVWPAVRAWMVRLQQQMGAAGGAVMEGRDIGTVVFPRAQVKIFLDAAPEVRGLRRYDQLGPAPAVQPDEVIRDLRARDERDRNRADSPLRPAPDAVLLDSTQLTLEEVLDAAEAIVANKLALLLKDKQPRQES
jgi:cytidylate kinase